MGQPAASDLDSYDGHEAGVPEQDAVQAYGDAYFQVTARPIPAGSVPIMDDEHQTVIGYRGPYISGVAGIYDLEGRQVSLTELPLESPIVDHVDLVLIFGSLGRIVVRGLFRAGSEVAGETAARLATRKALERFVPLLRLAFRQVVRHELRFAPSRLPIWQSPVAVYQSTYSNLRSAMAFATPIPKAFPASSATRCRC